MNRIIKELPNEPILVKLRARAEKKEEVDDAGVVPTKYG